MIVAIAAVGSLNPRISPGSISIPDQIIDYTYSRAQTFFEENLQHVTHIDFTYPYCEALRQALLRAAAESGIEATGTATYGATQGPRLETKAEIDRMGRDGCDLVGMTGMPEAALARELDLCYACCAVVANWAAGRGDGLISMEEIEGHLKDGMHKVYKILSKLFISV